MNWKLIFKILCTLFIIIGVAMFPPFITGLIYRETREASAFIATAIFFIVVGACGVIFIHPRQKSLKPREGFLIVALCWVIFAVIGAIPLLLSMYVSSFIDAFFETCAAFTTTGATVLSVETMPRSVMMWLAVSHWIGGMGIVVFAISIMPSFGIGGQNLFRAESPGLQMTKLATRVSDSARILYGIYISFTVVEFLLLRLGGMNSYDSIISTLGSVSTSGLFSHPEGLAYYDSPYVEGVLALFTVLASVNFSLYLFAVQGKLSEVFKDLELRVFLLIILAAGILIGGNLYFSGTYDSIWQSIRYSFFQAITFITTSGYAITNYTDWPGFSKCLLLLIMCIGGCGASTCGAIKTIRIVVMVKLVFRNIYQRLHPRAVVAVKVSGKPIPAPVVSQITSFLMTFAISIVLGSLILSLQGLDFTTTVSSAMSMLTNTGIAFGEVGSTSNYSVFCAPLRLVLCFLMLLGRLEIFTLLFLFTPSFWNPEKLKG